MKKYLFLILALACLLTCGCSQDNDYLLSQKGAWKIVHKKVRNTNLKDVEVWVSKNMLPPGSEIEVWGKSLVSPDTYCWLFFIDDYPGADWGHDSRYVFVDANDGQFGILYEEVPPCGCEDFFDRIQ